MRQFVMALALAALAGGVVGCTGGTKAGCPCADAGKVVLRVSAGATKDYVDAAGLKWLADQDYAEGKTWGAVGGNILWRDTLAKVEGGTPAPDVYFTERWSMSAYRFDLPNGTYTVRLHFAETYEEHSKPGDRIFSVKVQGREVLKDLDILKETGKFALPLIKEFKGVAVTDGKLMIEFTPKVQNPCIAGIEILAG